MKSICFVMKIKTDKIKDYIDIHKTENVWPEIFQNLKIAKINKLKIYLLENNAICYLESEDPIKSLKILGQQKTQIEWNKVTSDFMETQPEYDSTKIVEELKNVFEYES